MMDNTDPNFNDSQDFTVGEAPPYTFLAPDLKAGERNRAARRKQAMAMVERGNTDGGSMVGGIYVGDAGSRFLSSLAGSMQNSGLDDEDKAEAQQLQDVRQQLLARMNPEQRSAAQLSLTPGLEHAGNAAYGEAITAPRRKAEQQAAAEARKDTLRQTLEAKAAEAEANRQARIDDRNARADEAEARRQLSAEDRAAQAREARADRAANAAAIRAEKAATPKPLTPKQKETQRGFTDLEKSLDHYDGMLSSYDPQSGQALSPTNRAALESAFTDVQMKMKQLYELGAPQAGDMKLLEQSLANPTSIKGTLSGAAFGSGPMLAKTKELRTLLNNSRDSFDSQMGVESPRAARATTPQQSASGKVGAPQAAIDMLKKNPALAPAFKAKYGYLP